MGLVRPINLAKVLEIIIIIIIILYVMSRDRCDPHLNIQVPEIGDISLCKTVPENGQVLEEEKTKQNKE